MKLWEGVLVRMREVKNVSREWWVYEKRVSLQTEMKGEMDMKRCETVRKWIIYQVGNIMIATFTSA